MGNGVGLREADGIRFHLPALLMAELKGELRHDIMFTLCGRLIPYTLQQFSLLNGQQRQAIRRFLLWMLHEQAYEFDQPSIEKALASYWTESDTASVLPEKS